jgi:hypothetical protein
MITPIIGKTYIVKHTSGKIKAKFLRDAIYNPTFNPNRIHNDRRSTHHYVFQNLSSGREIILKSRTKIYREFVEGVI